MVKRGKEAGEELKKRHYLDAIYDRFRRKDMSRRAFKRAYRRIMDPKRLAREAEEIALHRNVLRTMRRK
jgi:hypothetical protein